MRFLKHWGGWAGSPIDDDNAITRKPMEISASNTVTRLFICTPTHALHGGVERILQSLAAHLPKRMCDVTFGLAKGARFHDPEEFRRALPPIVGVDVDGGSGTAYGRRRALTRAVTAADPDIVLIARMFDAYPVCCALKRSGHRLRLAVTVQGYEPEYLVDLARYADFVDLCVANGELVADAVTRFTSMPASCVRNIPGGVAPPLRVREAKNGPLRIGYVGRLDQVQKRARDLHLLVTELERRGIAFVCEVAGDGTVAAELRTRMPSTRFHGWLSTSDLYERVYPEIDVLVHFAEWEGSPIAPREAMAHGVVPIVSRFTGLQAQGQFIDGFNSLTFPVGDVTAAADCVARLNGDRALLERLSRAARASQDGIRSEEGAADAWAEAFRDALARPSRVGGVLPAAPRDHGLLARLGVPDSISEIVRRQRRRHHADPGSEWPHWSGVRDEELMRQVNAFGRE
jgi:glycosyltransferase involved in cell wall biosynthesis